MTQRLAQAGITLSPELAQAFGVTPPPPSPPAAEGGIDEATENFRRMASPSRDDALNTPPAPFAVMPTGMGVVPPQVVTTPQMDALSKRFSESTPEELEQMRSAFELRPEETRQRLQLTPGEFEALKIALNNSGGDRRQFLPRPAEVDDLARRVCGIPPGQPVTQTHLDQLQRRLEADSWKFVDEYNVDWNDYNSAKRYLRDRNLIPQRLQEPPDPNRPVTTSDGRVVKERDHANYERARQIEALGTLTQSSAAAITYGATKLVTDDEEFAWQMAGLAGNVAGVAGAFGHVAIGRQRQADVIASQPRATDRVVTINAPNTGGGIAAPSQPTAPPSPAAAAGGAPKGAETAPAVPQGEVTLDTTPTNAPRAIPRTPAERAQILRDAYGGRLQSQGGALEEAIRRANNRELRVAGRSAPLELHTLKRYLDNPNVASVTVVESAAGGRTPDFVVTYIDGTVTRVEVVTLTAAPAGRVEGPKALAAATMDRPPTVGAIRDAVRAKAANKPGKPSQLVSPIGTMPHVAAGGTIAVNIASSGENLRQTVDVAIRGLSPTIGAHVQRVEVSFLERTDTAGPLLRPAAVYVRNASGQFVPETPTP